MQEIQESALKIRKFGERITHATKRNDNALGKRIWDESPIYWKQESEYDFISKDIQEKITKLAFLESSFETPLVIRQRKRSSADAQIVVNWFGAKDEPYFKGKASTLAFAYGPGGSIGGDLTMNADQLWWLGKLTMQQAFDIGMIENFDRNFPERFVKTYDPLGTLKHEGGGHSLGMNHIETRTEQFTAIMYPFYNGLRKFGKADKDYLHQLYGKASISHKVRELLLNRISLG